MTSIDTSAVGTYQARDTSHLHQSMLPELPAVKALCYECEVVDEDRVLDTLGRLRRTIAKHSASEKLVEHVRALFDLLIDRRLRASFCSDALTALVAYELEPAEIDNFAAIRADGLSSRSSKHTASRLNSGLCLARHLHSPAGLLSPLESARQTGAGLV